MGRIARIIVVMLVVILAGLIAQPAWAAPPLPASMAAIGDSITRAYDVCCSYGDHPGQSWSTGSTSYDGITSHYERVKQLNSAITGHGYNDAVTVRCGCGMWSPSAPPMTCSDRPGPVCRCRPVGFHLRAISKGTAPKQSCHPSALA